MDCDVCVIGSGAGGGPVALTLAEAGYSVVVLEKGPWLTEQDFFKDEIACCRRNTYTLNLQEEFHVVEEYNGKKGWVARPTYDSSWDFWNGNMVGGSSNLMSGFFHRLKPKDFRLLSEFGPIEGANIADWPIDYDELEPYYSKVEHVVGISGRVVDHPNQEPRSTADFPFAPTAEHPIANWFDETCQRERLHSIPVPRAILPHRALGRDGCQYSGYCGSYGCSTGAKGSSRAALLNRAVVSGNCDIRPDSHVYRLDSDASGRVVAASYYAANGSAETVRAQIFVVACQAIETSRLLLLSPGSRHPHGLANNHGQVGRNLLFSAGGAGTGSFFYARLDQDKAAELDRLDADGVIGGHSGLPFTDLVEDRLWHNAGSVGLPANDGTPRAWFSVLAPDGDGIAITHHPLDYDHARAAAKMRAAGLPAAYARTLEDGLWPDMRVLPEAERRLRARPLTPGAVHWSARRPRAAR